MVWGTLLATVVGGVIASGVPIATAVIDRFRRDRIARRLWREDFYSAQNLLVTAIREQRWPDTGWRPRDDRGDLDAIAGRDPDRDRWTRFTVARRATIAVAREADGKRLTDDQVRWAAKAFRALEDGRQVLHVHDFPWKPHRHAETVNAASPPDNDPPDLFF